MNTRALAAKTLWQVLYEGHSLTDVLQGSSLSQLAPRDQALVRDICYGCLRWHERLSAILNKMLAKPLKLADKDIECLLRIGLYQRIYQRTPDHAAVNESVKAAKKMQKEWAGGLINGVLRNFIREQDAVLAEVDKNEIAYYSFPVWLIKLIKQAWPERWAEILTASNEHPPMILRVNRRFGSRDSYQQKLAQAGIEYRLPVYAEDALRIQSPVSVYELPDFSDGAVSVQDAAAQLAAEILNCQTGAYVLDACAAPGGKTCHLLERTESLEVLALDISEHRIAQVQDNLQRMKLQAKIKVADAAELESWWDGRQFDHILLDAPCSGTGVIRRHPDIKYLREPEDLVTLQQQQALLLERLWQTLRPGGCLLYVTCSIIPAENWLQVEHFLSVHSDAVELKIETEWGGALAVGRQILPGENGMDGFYYALLKKC